MCVYEYLTIFTENCFYLNKMFLFLKEINKKENKWFSYFFLLRLLLRLGLALGVALISL